MPLPGFHVRAVRDRIIDSFVALALGVGLALSPLFAGRIGDIPVNAVWIAVTTLVAFWLAPQVRDASPRQMLRTALKMTVVVVVVSAVVIGFWIGLGKPPVSSPANPEDQPLVTAVGLTLVGLLLFGWIGVLLGIPAAGIWAAIVRALLARDIRRR